jgi:transglutaminase-like putative cysteine protease
MALVADSETIQAFDHAALSPQEKLARAGGWWTLVFTLVMLGSVAEAVHASGWSDGLAVVRLAIMGGALIGFALALTNFSGTFAAFYGAVASIFWLVSSLHRVMLPDLGTHDAVRALVLTNARWLMALLRGGAGSDNLVFVTQLGIIGWWLGFYATWNLFRHRRVFYAVVPAGIALLIDLYYSPINLTGYLLVFLVAVLLISVRVELARNETRWQISRVRYAPDIYVDFIKAGVAFAAIVVLVSWAMPDVAGRADMERLFRPLDQPWKSVEKTWSRMYQSVHYPAVAPTVSRYGKDLALGGPVSLTDRPIFEAQFPERTYWRAAVYDHYDGRSWTDTNSSTTVVENGQWLGEPVFAATQEMTATIRPLEPAQDAILSPPQPLRVSVPVDADFSPIIQGGSLVSVSRMHSRVDINARVGYRVASAITQAPADALRADNTEYPQWVVERYLQLPETVSPRVVRLARQVTASYGDAYDKATAIESFLRQFKYDTEIAAPPEGRDAVDYFLFDIKEGYCDYYASAMAVMLRSVGIPSRLAAGYAPGVLLSSQDDKPMVTDSYQVQERDAHAWVEAFFPTYGWIQFEPTASQSPVQRPRLVEATIPVPTPTPEDDEEQPKDLRSPALPPTSLPPANPESVALRWIQDHLIALGATATLLALGLLIVLVARARHEAFLSNPELLASLLGLVGAWAGRLGISWPASDTPLERTARFGRRIPEAEGIVSEVASLFVAERYGRMHPTSDRVRGLANGWQRLQPALWRRWLRGVLRPGA